MRKILTPAGTELCGALFPDVPYLCTLEFEHDGDHYCYFEDFHELLESGFSVGEVPEFDVIVPMTGEAL